jgi:hypothetical protein
LAYFQWKLLDKEELEKKMSDLNESLKLFLKNMEEEYAKAENNLKDYAELNFPAAYHQLLRTQHAHYSVLEESSFRSPHLSEARMKVQEALEVLERTKGAKDQLNEYNQRIREAIQNAEDDFQKKRLEKALKSSEKVLEAMPAKLDAAGVADAV